MVAASKGGCHTCGVDLDGALRCWGCNERGEVGPVPEVAGGWIDVSAGKRFTCGVASADRAVRCWGRSLPQMRGAWFGPWAAVTAGEDWVCALRRDDRTAHCRGWSPTGQTDVPTTLRTVAFDALSAGFQHTCGVVASDKSLACWGADFFGEASAFPGPGVSGPGVSTRTLPVEDPTDPRAVRWGAVAAGTRRTCGVRGAARALECWGERREYPPVATAAFDEYGLVSRAGNSSARARVRGTWSPSGKTTPAEYSPSPRTNRERNRTKTKRTPPRRTCSRPGIFCVGETDRAGRRARRTGRTGWFFRGARGPRRRTSGDRVRRFRVCATRRPRRATRRQTRRDRSATEGQSARSFVSPSCCRRRSSRRESGARERAVGVDFSDSHVT